MCDCKQRLKKLYKLQFYGQDQLVAALMVAQQSSWK
jgi:hypothetical protein